MAKLSIQYHVKILSEKFCGGKICTSIGVRIQKFAELMVYQRFWFINGLSAFLFYQWFINFLFVHRHNFSTTLEIMKLSKAFNIHRRFFYEKYHININQDSLTESHKKKKIPSIKTTAGKCKKCIFSALNLSLVRRQCI